MNTTGVCNRDLNEQISFAQKCVIGLLRALLPPHADNEAAADFLRAGIGQSDGIDWVVVRPHGLSAIFDAGKTSRINVAAFMADLIADDGLWAKWKGRCRSSTIERTPKRSLASSNCCCSVIRNGGGSNPGLIRVARRDFDRGQ